MIRTLELLERETFTGIRYTLEIRDDDTAVVYHRERYVAYIVYDSADESYLVVDCYVPHHYVCYTPEDVWAVVNGIVETVAAE